MSSFLKSTIQRWTVKWNLARSARCFIVQTFDLNTIQQCSNELIWNTHWKGLILQRIWPAFPFETYLYHKWIYIPFLACSAPCTQKTVAPADDISIRISKSPAAASDLAGIQRKTFLSRRKLIRAKYSNQFTINVSVAIVCGFWHGRVKEFF